MECACCLLHFDLQLKRPRNLPCGHTICLSCLQSLAPSGSFPCPLDKTCIRANDVADFPESRSLMEVLTGAALICATPDHGEARDFCISHFTPTCTLCKHHECTSLDILENMDRVKFELYEELKKVEMKDLPGNLQEKWRGMSQLTLVELYRLYTLVERGRLKCCGCGKGSEDYLNLDSFTVYCTACYTKCLSKDPLLSAICFPTIQCIDSILPVLRSNLRHIHFFSLSPTHHDLLLHPPPDLPSLLSFAHDLTSLQHQPIIPLPDQFQCPQCRKTLLKGECQLRRLPCAQAVHVICEVCVQGCDEHHIKCPLDENEFSVTGNELEIYCKVERKEHVLAGKGIDFPGFRTPDSVPESLSVLDVFSKVLPAKEPILGLSPENKVFLEPWYINRSEYQVETLTIQPLADVSLWGIGLANPISPSKTAAVHWIRLYSNEQGRGFVYQKVEITNSQLTGDSILTDIFFSQGYRLPGRKYATLKVKFEVEGGEKRVGVYHGNHVGRRKDLEGSDGCGWNTRETEGVDCEERCNCQGHLIGPILRLIYRKN